MRGQYDGPYRIGTVSRVALKVFRCLKTPIQYTELIADGCVRVFLYLQIFLVRVVVEAFGS